MEEFILVKPHREQRKKLLVAIKDPNLVRIAKIELIGRQDKPGPALASIGINMADFTIQFNDETKDKNSEVIPCVIYAYKDKSFKFETKTTPTSIMLKKVAKIESGAKNQLTETGSTTSKEQALEIARYKMQDLNANDEAIILISAYGVSSIGARIVNINQSIKITSFKKEQN